MTSRKADYYLPPQTTRLLTVDHVKQCKNLGLLLDKYPPQHVIEASKSRGIFRSQWLQEIAEEHMVDTRLAKNMYRRWLHMTTAMKAQRFRALSDERIIVGMGNKTILETGLTLHHHYGIPFISASALKGVTRSYVTGEITEHKSTHRDEDDETVTRIFGSAHTTGTVVFFDALPLEGRFELTRDIINAHYPRYYSEQKPPTNDQRPDPVTFLTISNTIFVFALAPRYPERSAHRDDVNIAMKWLQEALQAYGIGGKSSAGYGYFTLLAED